MIMVTIMEIVQVMAIHIRIHILIRILIHTSRLKIIQRVMMIIVKMTCVVHHRTHQVNRI